MDEVCAGGEGNILEPITGALAEIDHIFTRRVEVGFTPDCARALPPREGGGCGVVMAPDEALVVPFSRAVLADGDPEAIPVAR